MVYVPYLRGVIYLQDVNVLNRTNNMCHTPYYCNY
jgi:hypothetical protein